MGISFALSFAAAIIQGKYSYLVSNSLNDYYHFNPRHICVQYEVRSKFACLDSIKDIETKSSLLFI